MTDTSLAIAHQGFIHGEKPTLADIALVGHLSMVEWAKPELLDQIDPIISNYMAGVRAN